MLVPYFNLTDQGNLLDYADESAAKQLEGSPSKQVTQGVTYR